MLIGSAGSFARTHASRVNLALIFPAFLADADVGQASMMGLCSSCEMMLMALAGVDSKSSSPLMRSIFSPGDQTGKVPVLMFVLWDW